MMGELHNKFVEDVKEALFWEECKRYNARLREIAETTGNPSRGKK